MNCFYKESKSKKIKNGWGAGVSDFIYYEAKFKAFLFAGGGGGG